jgi:hypothetical protein
MKTWEMAVIVFGVGAVVVYAFYEYWNLKEKIEKYLF